MPPSPADQANQELVDRLIAQGALWSPRLIAAFRATPRHRFLDRFFQYQRKLGHWHEVRTREPGMEELRQIYADRAIITHLSHGTAETPISSSSQPSLMAQMLHDLQLAPGQRILEIGAGTGYNVALLAHVVGAGQVISVDVDRHVLAEAREHLRAFPERHVEFRHADGRLGLREAAPFDRIMVTAATPDLEPSWLEQLDEGGVLVAPLVLAPGLAYVVQGTVREGVFHGRLTRTAYFMPLRAEDESVAGEGDTGLTPPAGSLRTVRAPWADWFDRKRPRMSWLGFIQAVAFFGHLDGLQISFHTGAGDQSVFGIHIPHENMSCLLGPQTWQVSGLAGRDLGWRLWRGFLDAGGPRPTEFRLFAVPHGHRWAPPPGQYWASAGPRCRHEWQLLEERERPSWV
jgi:protein-L-isoaspartate(D-aspartate) O-methyltransferase